MKTQLQIVASIVLIFGLTACASVGYMFDFKGPQSLVVGKTTRDEVIRDYGNPFRVGYDNGNLKWTYGYYKYRVFGDTDTKDLEIIFSANGTIKDYSYSTSLKDEKEQLLESSRK